MHTQREREPAVHLESQLTRAVFLLRPSSFLYFSPSLPDSRPPSFGRFFRGPSCNHSTFKTLPGDRWTRTAGDGWGGGGTSKKKSFQIPRHLNIRTNSIPLSRWSFELPRPLELPSVDQRTDTNRGCIQRALARAPSVAPPSISSPAWMYTAPVTPAQGFSLSLCWRTVVAATVAEDGVRYWRSEERHFHRKTAVSGAASFYVLRSIVNTRPAVGAFICSSGSCAHSASLSSRSLFEQLARHCRR